MDSDIKQEKCEFCGEYVPRYNTIYVAPEKEYLCSCLTCFNKRMTEYSALILIMSILNLSF
jgi:hypothetical protein